MWQMGPSLHLSLDSQSQMPAEVCPALQLWQACAALDIVTAALRPASLTYGWQLGLWHV